MRRLAFNTLADLVGWGLYWLARLARAMGDVHEIRHLAAQVDVGDSSGCTPGHCCLDPRRGSAGALAATDRKLLQQWLDVYDSQSPIAERVLELREVADETRYHLAHDFELSATTVPLLHAVATLARHLMDANCFDAPTARTHQHYERKAAHAFGLSLPEYQALARAAEDTT